MLALSSFPIPVGRLSVAALLLSSAVLTGCNGSSESAAVDNFPSLLGTSHFNGETVDTLGANYTLPPDTRHRVRLHEAPVPSQPRYTHRSL